MKITTKIILGLLGGLILSGIVNYVQYRIYHREPVVDTVIERDTVMQLDTVYQIVQKDTTIYKPQPVIVDTVLDIRVYRDTIYHTYGWTSFESTIQGSLLSQTLGFQFSVPNYYTTRTITNTITHTVRNNCLFVTGGLNYNYVTQGFYPSAGVTYIWNKHKRIISLEYSLDKRIDLSVGFSLWR
jgi:hypothetical protein